MFHTTKLWKELAVLIKGKYCTLEQSSFCPTALEVLHIYLYEKNHFSFFISNRSSLLTARCIIYFRYKSICELMGKVYEEVTKKEVVEYRPCSVCPRGTNGTKGGREGKK